MDMQPNSAHWTAVIRRQFLILDTTKQQEVTSYRVDAL